MPTGQEPAEGDRKTIERELARQDGGSIKNPEQEAANPGGRPTPAVKTSATPKPAEPAGQQGKTHNAPPSLAHPQRGN